MQTTNFKKFHGRLSRELLEDLEVGIYRDSLAEDVMVNTYDPGLFTRLCVSLKYAPTLRNRLRYTWKFFRSFSLRAERE